MSTNDTQLEPIRRFRMVAVRLTLIIVALEAAVAWLIEPRAAQGVLLGGIAGVLGFWVMAVRLEKITRVKPSKVKVAALTWSTYRYLLYGAVLYKAFTLDTESYTGLLGALVGIMTIRFVLVAVGAFGLDLKATPEDEEVISSAAQSDDERTET